MPNGHGPRCSAENHHHLDQDLVGGKFNPLFFSQPKNTSIIKKEKKTNKDILHQSSSSFNLSPLLQVAPTKKKKKKHSMSGGTVNIGESASSILGQLQLLRAVNYSIHIPTQKDVLNQTSKNIQTIQYIQKHFKTTKQQPPSPPKKKQNKYRCPRLASSLGWE